MASARFFTPTKLVFAAGASRGLLDELRALRSRRPLVVSDPGVAKAGLVARVVEPLAAAGITAELFTSVEANPLAATVHAGVAAAYAAGCDAVVAIGGGSAIDAAKAMAILHAHPGDIRQYEYGQRPFARAGLPFISIPTTAGTGSEVTWWSVITDPDTHRKFDVGDPRMAAVAALVDPELTLGLPARVTAATGMDAFTHALEAYTTKGRNPLTDGHALAAMELLAAHLPAAVANGADLAARTQVMLAATTAGLAFSNVGLGAVHGLTAPIGGHLGAAHGEANAALLPAVVRFNAPAVPERYARIARLFGWTGSSDTDGAAHLARSLGERNRSLGIPRVRDLGVTATNIPLLARDALGPISNCNSNPRSVSQTDAEAILLDALTND
jgi:alcohol dehydrogenase class IV